MACLEASPHVIIWITIYKHYFGTTLFQSFKPLIYQLYSYPACLHLLNEAATRQKPLNLSPKR